MVKKVSTKGDYQSIATLDYPSRLGKTLLDECPSNWHNYNIL